MLKGIYYASIRSRIRIVVSIYRRMSEYSLLEFQELVHHQKSKLRGASSPGERQGVVLEQYMSVFAEQSSSLKAENLCLSQRTKQGHELSKS